jgi:hypothetical protein
MVNRLHIRVRSIVVLLVVLSTIPGYFFIVKAEDAPKQAAAMPFAPGERLRFALRWSVIPAGEGVLEVLPMEVINGVECYHFRMTAETNSFVDMFYKVRDRIDSYTDKEMTHSVRYIKKQQEGDSKRNLTVEFDWNSKTSFYKDEEKTKTIDVLPGAFDPLSIFYFSRLQRHWEGDSLHRPIADGLICFLSYVRIVKRERIDVFTGSYDTLLLEPEMEHIGGVFEKSKGAKIKVWVTDDQQRMPVKIASKVVVGSFVGELMAIE